MVDSDYALYLQSPERIATASSAPQSAKWGALARGISVSSPFADEIGANAEAARRLAFFAGPLRRESVRLRKIADIAAIKGKVVTISGTECFVLGGQSDEASGYSVLFIVVRGAL